MPLSLTTRRLNSDVTATNTNLFRLHQHHSNSLNQPVQKQKSIKETLNLNKNILTTNAERSYLSRGLLLERPHDKKRSSYCKQKLKKHSSITTQYCNGKNDQETFKTGDLLKRNKQSDSDGEFLRNTRKIQAWSSTTSILKTLDRELAQLNGVAGKCKAAKVKATNDVVDIVNLNETKSDSASPSDTPSPQLMCKQTQAEVNKVNLSIVLSHTLNSTKEDNDFELSDQELDEEDGVYTSSNSSKIVISYPKQKNNNTKSKSTSNSSNTSTSIRSPVSAQQRRTLFQTSKLATNSAFNSHNNSATALNSGIQNSQNYNVPSSATIKKRPPLVRAMSAPVRSFEETTKVSSTFLNSKRKSRRERLNTRNFSCDKGSYDILTTKNFDSKAAIRRNVLRRSKSVAPDVVTLVSLINSEESDSEKDDTVSNVHTTSPNKRAPCLRKTGKSVSFQENYPPSFQFASKEYSHMLRRGFIAPLTQRIKSNRPPTAPPGSIYHITHKIGSEMPDANIESNKEVEKKEKESNLDMSNTLSETDKNLQEEFKFPEYVRSLKERECWKLFMKMSTKGVIITYDTISRGMLTPTEYRQLQKQRKIEEAKALKEAEEKSVFDEITKRPHTGLERLKESLLNS